MNELFGCLHLGNDMESSKYKANIGNPNANRDFSPFTAIYT